MFQAIDQMYLSADRPLAAWRGGFDLLDDVRRTPGQVGFLDDIPIAFGMDNDLHRRVRNTELVDVLGAKELVDGTVTFPEDEVGGAELLGGVAAQIFARIPDDHFVERVPHLVRRITAKVLVGEEENLGIENSGSRTGRCAFTRSRDLSP